MGEYIIPRPARYVREIPPQHTPTAQVVRAFRQDKRIRLQIIAKKQNQEEFYSKVE
jgi:hypothetical protein